MREFDYIGKYKIIDGHTHLPGPMYEADPRVRERLLFPIITADELVAHMKNYGINRFITFPSHWNTSDVVRDRGYHTPNDQIAEAQKKYPDNIIGFGRVQPNFKGNAEKEARRCFEELGLKGLKVHGKIDNIGMGAAERWRPIMELLAKYEYPLIAHSGIDRSSDSPGQFHVMADTFPDVNIIMAHSSARHRHDAMVVAKRCENIYLGISHMGGRNIMTGVKMGMEDKLIYESDTPNSFPNSAIMRVSDHPWLTQKQKIKILGGNLARLLKL